MTTQQFRMMDEEWTRLDPDEREAMLRRARQRRRQREWARARREAYRSVGMVHTKYGWE